MKICISCIGMVAAPSLNLSNRHDRCVFTSFCTGCKWSSAVNKKRLNPYDRYTNNTNQPTSHRCMKDQNIPSRGGRLARPPNQVNHRTSAGAELRGGEKFTRLILASLRSICRIL